MTDARALIPHPNEVFQTPVEPLFKIDRTGKVVYRNVLSTNSSAAAIKLAKKETDKLFENKAFRAHAANKMYAGWEIAKQQTGLVDDKSGIIMESITNLLRGL